MAFGRERDARDGATSLNADRDDEVTRRDATRFLAFLTFAEPHVSGVVPRREARTSTRTIGTRAARKMRMNIALDLSLPPLLGRRFTLTRERSLARGRDGLHACYRNPVIVSHRPDVCDSRATGTEEERGRSVGIGGT